MTLDETIKRFEALAESYESYVESINPKKLAEWLKELKQLKEADVQPADTKEILRHLDSLMICVGNAYNTSHGLLESDMEFIEKQEKIIKELCGADMIGIKNELDYCPFDYNMHTLRITLNYCGAVGHISFLRGGNCKGANILDTALTFFADCDEAELARLVEDDCGLEMFKLDNEILFNVTLHKGDDEYEFEAISEDELQDMIVAVEIADCKGQIEVEDT